MYVPNLMPACATLRSHAAASQVPFSDLRATLIAYGSALGAVGSPQAPVRDLVRVMDLVTLRPSEAPAAAQAAVSTLTSQGLFPFRGEDETAFLSRLRDGSHHFRNTEPLGDGPVTGYRTQRRIGAGCFSEVFLAEDLKTGRDVALKIYRPPFDQAKEGDVPLRGIFNELRFQGFVDSKAIVRVLHCGLAAGAVPFLAMEYMPGGGLSEAIKAMTESPSASGLSSMDLAELVLRVMAGVHEAGILHGDIVLHNLLMNEERDRLWASDFALSRRISETPYNFEAFGAKGRKTEGLTYDVFQLGKVLYQIFAQYPNDISDLSIQRSPSAVRKRPDLKIPSWVDDLIARAVHVDIDERFPDATALFEAFRARR